MKATDLEVRRAGQRSLIKLPLCHYSTHSTLLMKLTVECLLHILLAERISLGHKRHHLLDLRSAHIRPLQLPHPASHVLQLPRRVNRNSASTTDQDAAWIGWEEAHLKLHGRKLAV